MSFPERYKLRKKQSPKVLVRPRGLYRDHLKKVDLTEKLE